MRVSTPAPSSSVKGEASVVRQEVPRVRFPFPSLESREFKLPKRGDQDDDDGPYYTRGRRWPGADARADPLPSDSRGERESSFTARQAEGPRPLPLPVAGVPARRRRRL